MALNIINTILRHFLYITYKSNSGSFSSNKSKRRDGKQNIILLRLLSLPRDGVLYLYLAEFHCSFTYQLGYCLQTTEVLKCIP